MPRQASVVGLVAKWLGAPLAFGAIGYFVVAPRIAKHPPAAAPKTVAQIETPVPESSEVPPKQEAEPPKPKPKPETAPAAEKPKAESVIDPSERPVLEVTTDKPLVRPAPAPVRKRSHRRRSAPKKPDSTAPAATDQGSDAAPADAGQAPAGNGPQEPATTPR